MAGRRASQAVQRSRETEWKLTPPEGSSLDAVAPNLTITVDTAHTTAMVACYYDTADLALARRGATLRRREGGADEGWHLKVPAVSGKNAGRGTHRRERDELVLPLSSVDDGPPADLLTLVRAWTLDAPLSVVARLSTSRTVHPLRALDGRLIGEWADDTVQVHGSDPARWSEPALDTFSEWEIEARDGEEPACAAVVAELLELGATGSRATSKLRRALRLDERTYPLPLNPGAPRNPSAADVLRDTLAVHAEAFAFFEHRVHMDLDDAVHRMRVEARRLRSTLRTFAPLLDTEVLTPLRTEVEWAADVLGEERDLEVVQQRLIRVIDGLTPMVDADADRADSARVLNLVGQVLVDERQRVHAHVVQQMSSERWVELHRALARVAADPPTTPRAERAARDLLPGLVERQWRSFAKRADRLTLHAPAEDWHRVRIGGKRVRYAADLVAPVLGRPAERFARHLARMTDLLGDFQDSHLVRDHLDRWLAPGSSTLPPVIDPADARSMFVLGRAYASEERAAEHLQREFLEQWSTMKPPGHRRWARG